MSYFKLEDHYIALVVLHVTFLFVSGGNVSNENYVQPLEEDWETLTQ